MKKLFSLFIIFGLLLYGGVVFAESPDLPNAIIVDGYNGATGISPMTHIIKVRYGKNGASQTGITSGDAVAWDVNSADGVTIKKMDGTWSTASEFAGIAVTSFQTWDAGATTVRGTDRNWGYIAIKGYCMASIDAATTAGESLTVTSTGGLGSNKDVAQSQDVGVLLETASGAGKYHVWLR